MTQPSVAERILKFNAGRDPERLKMKLRALRSDPFLFLRGTCHLFYEHLPDDNLLSTAPLSWACGDLHLQNYGSYKGNNRLVYFDINDFDESALAPCTWDALRLLASILVGADSLGINEAEAVGLCHQFLCSYRDCLVFGKAMWVDRDLADGMVGDLLASLRDTKRKDFLDGRTVFKGKQRRFPFDGKRTLPVDEVQFAAVAALIQQVAEGESNPDFYRVLDIARRIAGTGSLGVERYAILVEGKGSPDQNVMLDLKLATPSSLAPHLPTPQPLWRNEAQRVVSVQQRMQAISMAFLRPVQMNGASYVLRALQPAENKVDFSAAQGDMRQLEGTVAVMGNLLAWAQLRSSGRQGSAPADALMDFAGGSAWMIGMLDLAQQMAQQVLSDWREYVASDVGK